MNAARRPRGAALESAPGRAGAARRRWLASRAPAWGRPTPAGGEHVDRPLRSCRGVSAEALFPARAVRRPLVRPSAVGGRAVRPPMRKSTQRPAPAQKPALCLSVSTTRIVVTPLHMSQVGCHRGRQSNNKFCLLAAWLVALGHMPGIVRCVAPELFERAVKRLWK